MNLLQNSAGEIQSETQKIGTDIGTTTGEKAAQQKELARVEQELKQKPDDKTLLEEQAQLQDKIQQLESQEEALTEEQKQAENLDTSSETDIHDQAEKTADETGDDVFKGEK